MKIRTVFSTPELKVHLRLPETIYHFKRLDHRLHFLLISEPPLNRCAPEEGLRGVLPLLPRACHQSEVRSLAMQTHNLREPYSEIEGSWRGYQHTGGSYRNSVRSVSVIDSAFARRSSQVIPVFLAKKALKCANSAEKDWAVSLGL